jgi:hypothetical protein
MEKYDSLDEVTDPEERCQYIECEKWLAMYRRHIRRRNKKNLHYRDGYVDYRMLSVRGASGSLSSQRCSSCAI